MASRAYMDQRSAEMLVRGVAEGASTALFRPSGDDSFDLRSLKQAIAQPTYRQSRRSKVPIKPYAAVLPQKQQNAEEHGFDYVLHNGEIERLFNLDHQLYIAAIRDDKRRASCGADIPLNARMTTVWAGEFVTDFAIQLHQGDSEETKLVIPIFRKWWDCPRGTIGLLVRRPQDELVTVVSGRLTQGHEERQQLRPAEWIDLVFEMCEAINHHLLPSGFDGDERPGSYRASHAEMLLLAYVYFKPHRLDRVTIHVSEKVCAHCAKGTRAFEEYTRIKVTVLHAGY